MLATSQLVLLWSQFVVLILDMSFDTRCGPLNPEICCSVLAKKKIKKKN